MHVLSKYLRYNICISYNNTLNDLTEQEIVAKSNKAIEQMAIAKHERDIIFLGAKKLNNGGIVLYLEKPEMACWLQQNKKYIPREIQHHIHTERLHSIGNHRVCPNKSLTRGPHRIP